MTFTTTPAIPRETAGTWTIDPVRSEIGFSVRHTVGGRVHGTFSAFSGQIVIGTTPSASRAHAIVEMGSVDTGVARRDSHLRSPDFFDIAAHPTMEYRSTALRERGSQNVLDGELTIKGTTKPISLNLELRGVRRDPDGATRVGFAANAALARSDFGVDFNLVLRVGGVLIADRVDIHLEIEAVLDR